jgi:hypothetical protein
MCAEVMLVRAILTAGAGPGSAGARRAIRSLCKARQVCARGVCGTEDEVSLARR